MKVRVEILLVLLLTNMLLFVIKIDPVNSETPEVASSQGLVNAMASAQAIGVPHSYLSVNKPPTESCLTLYTAGGQTLSIPENLAGPQLLSLFTLNTSSTVFVNDKRGGDRVDILLRNYTMLSQDYLHDGAVRVIVLMGARLSSDIYEISPPSGLEVNQLCQELQESGGKILSTYASLPFITAELPYDKVFEFAESDNVAHVFLDKKYRVQIAESVPLIKPPTTWKQIEAQFGFAINGSGVKIAILDTGVDKNHPDLNDLDDNLVTNDPKVIDEMCFTDENHTWDGFGHGTHCASIAAGTGEASNHTRVGVAPGALLLNGKVLTDGGWGYDSWIISGIEWAVNRSAKVLSMSFGSSVNGDGSDPLSMAVDWATDSGLICAVAAGNAGTGGMFTAGTPAVSRNAISVGATSKTDAMADFSSQGPTSDYRLKPDVCAPGVGIVAARANGTSMGTVIDENYTMASGTSMATPHVAGAAALIIQAHPGWNPIMVKSSMMGSAKMLGGEHLWRQGAGRIDACKATNTTLLIVNPSSSFGVLKLGDAANTTLTIINLANVSAAVTMSELALCEGQEVSYASINASSIAIPGHGSATVALQVGPIDALAPEGWYEGWVNATLADQGRYMQAPFLFASLSEITVTVYDTDNTSQIDAGIVLTTSPDLTYVDYSSASWVGPEYEAAHFFSKSGDHVLCAQMAGIYNVFHQYDFARMFMLEKLVYFPKASSINISISLADAKISQIPTVDSSGNNLTVHSFTQFFSGGPQTWYNGYFQLSQWSTGSGWYGFDLNVSQLTFYSTDYTPPDRLCEALGYYASDTLHSEVYLMPLKYWNVSSLPSTLSYPESDLAKYHIFYNMPETYPENGLNTMNAFWFTWDHIGSLQGWGWDVHRVPAGINATYYLAPQNGTYWGEYMPTYGGWVDYNYGPNEDWKIGQDYPYPQIPPVKGETGNIVLGKFSFGPYQPGLNLNVSRTGNTFLLNLTGDIWTNLLWPHSEGPLSPYPKYYAGYRIYIDGTLFEEGNLNGVKGYDGKPYMNHPPDYPDVDWCGINKTWDLSSSRVMLQLFLPSLATASRHTIYNMSFTLGSGDSTPPILTGISYPLNYTPGQDLKINFTTMDAGLGIESHFLKYSFDNGTTWQSATYQQPNYIIHCAEADSLAVLINATDKAGNSLQYLAAPISLCNKVKLDASLEDSGKSIHGNLTSTEHQGLSGIAVSLSRAQQTAYTIADDSGGFTFNFSHSDILPLYIVASASVGFYGSERVNIGQEWDSTAYLENVCNKLQFGNSWSKVLDSSSWSGLVMRASASSSNDGCLYGPYMTTGWDGASMLGKPYTATFRLKVSSNVSTSVIGYIDVCYNAGPALQSRQIKASDFASPNTWQDFKLTFITPSSLTAGLEFRVTNHNNGITDLYADFIVVSRRWGDSTVYVEGAYNKQRYGTSWTKISDSSSWSGLVMKAQASSSNGGCLYGPYITTDWSGRIMLGLPFAATFRLKTSSITSSNDLVNVDVCFNAGTVLQSVTIKANDFAAPNTWQDFKISFIAPKSMIYGLEFRVRNLNNGLADIYVDCISVERPLNTSGVYVEAAYGKQVTGSSWLRVIDSSSFSGTVMKVSGSSFSGAWLYGPYISEDSQGGSMLGKLYTASLRLKVSSNTSSNNVAYIDVCYNAGAVIQSRTIKASDFSSPNSWQEFQLSFAAPNTMTAGLEFRVENLNNGVADLCVDYISVSPRWNASTAYAEGAYNKQRSGGSWSNVNDPSSWSGIVMKAAASSPNGGCLYGPYISSDWDARSMLGKSYVVSFRLKVSSNLSTDNVVRVDVCYNAGTVLQLMFIKASDFTSSNTWQDFQLAFTTPSYLTYGLEFRVINLNNGVTDIFADQLAVNTIE
jgi:subtilisin family serine protease